MLALPFQTSLAAAANKNLQPAATAVPEEKTASETLQSILTEMDNAAANFKSAQADLQWDQYSMAANETDTQTGQIYFRKKKNETEMAAHFDKPKKIVVYVNGTLRLYEANLDQITEYAVGKDREEIESFLSIGFGGKGHDLLNSFQVSYDGSETIDNVKTEKLVLIPKTPKVKKLFDKIVLWIDPKRSVSLKQQFFEPSGDHRFAYYRNIGYGVKIPEDRFKLPSTAHTKVVHPE